MEYIKKMTNAQQNLLNYIDDEENSEGKLQNIKDILTNDKIKDNPFELKSFLYILLKISNNHHRNSTFFSKIDSILKYLEDELRKNFSNYELFHIFKSNKRILLFLVEEKMIIFDKPIIKKLLQGKYLDAKYPHYFQPEIQPFINEKWFPKSRKELILEFKKGIPEHFYEKRKIGENDDFVCELIRKDSLNEFISYINQNNSKIKQSIYETNNFIFQNPEIIEYSAFFGSIQIFKYLLLNKFESNVLLWLFAIHGKNSEIIHLLEENQEIEHPNELYKLLFIESIKCHHNEFADYIQNNYLEIEKVGKVTKYYLKNYNFNYIENEIINETTFNYLCKYDYYTLVSILLNSINVDINQKTIFIRAVSFCPQKLRGKFWGKNGKNLGEKW